MERYDQQQQQQRSHRPLLLTVSCLPPGGTGLPHDVGVGWDPLGETSYPTDWTVLPADGRRALSFGFFRPQRPRGISRGPIGPSECGGSQRKSSFLTCCRSRPIGHTSDSPGQREPCPTGALRGDTWIHDPRHHWGSHMKNASPCAAAARLALLHCTPHWAHTLEPVRFHESCRQGQIVARKSESDLPVLLEGLAVPF